ncbi:MAG TPA: hypothetical protein VNN77_15170 [candidate division Zixibacteria bacterium]|nr:hypothetical protein [candidate division Zixibacteria bacterium]
MAGRKRAPAALVVVLLIASGPACDSPPAGPPPFPSAAEAGPAAAPDSGAPDRARAPDNVTEQGEFSLARRFPRQGVLLALERWDATTMVVRDLATRESVQFARKATGDTVASLASGRLAYLVRETVNPSGNYIEVLDLGQRHRSIRIVPARDLAVLGFALSPTGEHLGYAEIDLRRSRSERVFWRIAVVDLLRRDFQVSLVPEKTHLSGGVVPVPFAWSRATRDLYLQGLQPFRGMATQGIWSMSPNGSSLREILPEPSYTGLPRLSPDGASLGYLSSHPESLPRSGALAGGAPPGNVLSVMDLRTGQSTIVAKETQAVFGAQTWSAAGTEIVVSRRRWLDGRFRDADLLRVERGSAAELHPLRPPPDRVAGIEECFGSLLWVEERPGESRLVGSVSGAAPATLLALREERIRIVGCWGA